MIILAIELSTVRASAALLADSRCMAERSWIEKTGQAQPLFRHVNDLCRETGVALEAIGLFACGRGPGAYSGLRIAVTAAQAWALPGQREVYAVDSGEALAAAVACGKDIQHVAVVGDARRDHLWMGLFESAGDGLKLIRPWSVVRPGDLAGELPSGTLCVTSDWSRLQPTIQKQAASLEWIREDRFPEARDVGLLAWGKKHLGRPSEPLTPIYLHPSVAK